MKMVYHFNVRSSIMEEENNILFHITLSQAEAIARHFEKDIEDLEDYEICELLDRILDEEI